jgi:hypothetical protein
VAGRGGMVCLRQFNALERAVHNLPPSAPNRGI